MGSLLKRNPNLSMAENFQNLVDRFFGDISFPALGEADFTLPATDICETDNAYVISTELPGIKKEDIKVSMQDGVLTIEGETTSETTEEKDRKFLRKERKYGKFMRRFTVGQQADEGKIEAQFDDGVLRLTLPKLSTEPQTKARLIAVK